MVSESPRVDLVDPGDAPLLVRRFFAEGSPGPLGAAAAPVPEVMLDFMPFIGAVYAGGSVDERLREIVILRLSARQGCLYCTETHADIALRSGFSPTEVRSLIDSTAPLAGWSKPEAKVVQFADAMSADPNSAVGLLRPGFADHEVVELVMLASATIMLNRFATALALPTATDCKRRLGKLPPA
ncbi:MAG: hypothetical protein NVSMB17_04420 [Candidatus Dormibacteria bacterium]